jgi:hypothetical protein
MLWKVDGAKVTTGQDVTLTIEAADEYAARREASAGGVLVASVVPAPGVGPMNRMNRSHIADFRKQIAWAEGTGALIVLIGILSVIAGPVIWVGWEHDANVLRQMHAQSTLVKEKHGESEDLRESDRIDSELADGYSKGWASFRWGIVFIGVGVLVRVNARKAK